MINLTVDPKDQNLLSKTSNKNINHLEGILNDLNKAISYLKDDQTFVCIETRGSTTLDYYNEKEDHHLRPMEKFVGSKLMCLVNAKKKLKQHIKQAGRQ